MWLSLAHTCHTHPVLHAPTHRTESATQPQSSLDLAGCSAGCLLPSGGEYEVLRVDGTGPPTAVRAAPQQPSHRHRLHLGRQPHTHARLVARAWRERGHSRHGTGERAGAGPMCWCEGESGTRSWPSLRLAGLMCHGCPASQRGGPGRRLTDDDVLPPLQVDEERGHATIASSSSCHHSRRGGGGRPGGLAEQRADQGQVRAHATVEPAGGWPRLGHLLLAWR